jgi:DNA-binding IclR family transcriptional regulator
VTSTTIEVGQEKPDEHRSQVQVIARAAAILRTLEGEDAGLSLGKIAERVGLARSTVQRIVNALTAEDLLIAASPTGRVTFGPALLRLAGSATNFAALTRPYLLRLAADLQETVDLAIIRNRQAIFIDQVEGSHRLRAVSAIGEAFPLHCTANGKAYLATLADETVRQLLGPTLERRTPRSIVDVNALLADLKGTRASGVAVDREEHTAGICAIGIALNDRTGHPHAISVPVPTGRFDAIAGQIRRRLLEVKADLQTALDGQPISPPQRKRRTA